jgi:hypothetical protein
MTQTSYWTATAFAAVSKEPEPKEPEPEPKEPVTLYNYDGSMYTGHVNENGAKHGQGTLKTEICISGVLGDENSHCMKWTEFTGNWDNGLMHGHGVMREVSSNDKGIGPSRVVYEGMWDNGVPAPAPSVTAPSVTAPSVTAPSCDNGESDNGESDRDSDSDSDNSDNNYDNHCESDDEDYRQLRFRGLGCG